MTQPQYMFEVGIIGGNTVKSQTSFAIEHNLHIARFASAHPVESGKWLMFSDAEGITVFMAQTVGVAFVRRGELLAPATPDPVDELEEAAA